MEKETIQAMPFKFVKPFTQLLNLHHYILISFTVHLIDLWKEFVRQEDSDTTHDLIN